MAGISGFTIDDPENVIAHTPRVLSDLEVKFAQIAAMERRGHHGAMLEELVDLVNGLGCQHGINARAMIA